jgi:hypothetical protein
MYRATNNWLRFGLLEEDFDLLERGRNDTPRGRCGERIFFRGERAPPGHGSRPSAAARLSSGGGRLKPRLCNFISTSRKAKASSGTLSTRPVKHPLVNQPLKEPVSPSELRKVWLARGRQTPKKHAGVTTYGLWRSKKESRT